MRQKNLEFSNVIKKKKVIRRSYNRCERCFIDFDDNFVGEFHHIIPIIYGGKNDIDNCSLLCYNCHLVAPNIKDEIGLFYYKYYFLRFASFKEAAEFYKVDNRSDLYIKIAQDAAKNHIKN